MQNFTSLFPGFHLQTLRRKPRSERQILAEKVQQLQRKTISQLGVCFDKFIPKECLIPAASGELSRRRFFSKENIFWAFFSQVLDADGGCQEVVRKLQAYAAIKSEELPSSSTSAYCQARIKFDQESLREILRHTSQRLQQMMDTGRLNGRRVIVVDGTGVSMSDTEVNQAVWPQPANQKPGCGFPQASLCACFCLQSGALLSYEVGNKKSHQLPMLRKQMETFKRGDIFLGDKGFCSYFDVSSFNDRGVDSVITLARRIPATEVDAIKVLGKDDLLRHWKKPVRSKASSYSQSDWEQLPETLTLRQIKVTVDQPGFRVSSFYIVTTLLDAQTYSTDEIVELYFQRWDVELFFRDIKTTMAMDILRCKTPDMVRKEIMMHLIVYNCIRGLMIEAAKEKGVSVREISFKGSIQSLRQWEPHLNQGKLSKQERARLIQFLYESVADKIVADRPGRSEPRAVKRRPKPFQLLNKPRHEMIEIKHRSRHRANGS